MNVNFRYLTVVIVVRFDLYLIIFSLLHSFFWYRLPITVKLKQVHLCLFLNALISGNDPIALKHSRKRRKRAIRHHSGNSHRSLEE